MPRQYLTLSMTTLLLTLQFGCASSNTGSATDRPLSSKAVAAYNETVTNEADKVVCKRVKVTSSKITQRVCKTVGQMKEEEEAANRLMDSMMNTVNGTPQG